MTPPNQEPVVAFLERLLADSHTLYRKTQNYQLSVTGPIFDSLHAMLEAESNDLALAIDEIAERICAKFERAPGGYAEFAALGLVQDETETRSAKEMIEALLADQITLFEAARRVLSAAEEAGDAVSADLGTRRMEVHEKNAWMLRSHLD